MEVLECMEKGSEKILLVATGAQSVEKGKTEACNSLRLVQWARYETIPGLKN